MRRFPEELGKLGFVFNFITYGGHQIDGLAAEEFATALRQDGMLALARLQRKFRLVESPYRTPQTLVGGPRLDAALMAVVGPHRGHQGDGQGLDAAPAPGADRGADQAARGVARRCGPSTTSSPHALRVGLRPHTAGSELLELSLFTPGGEKVANVIFAHHRGSPRPQHPLRSATRTPSTRRCARSA